VPAGDLARGRGAGAMPAGRHTTSGTSRVRRGRGAPATSADGPCPRARARSNARAASITSSSTQARGAAAQCPGNRVAGPRIHHDLLALHREMDRRDERVLAQVGGDHAIDSAAEVVDEVPRQLEGHRPRHRHVLDPLRAGVRLAEAARDRQHPLAILVPDDPDRGSRERVLRPSRSEGDGGSNVGRPTLRAGVGS